MRTAIESFKKLIKKYRHAWVLLYGFYLFSVVYLSGKTQCQRILFIHSPLDDYIPFVEYFIVPYLLWFAFIAAAILYFLFTDKEGFYKLTAFLFTGMTIFLIICSIFPNALQLRPETFARDNIFCRYGSRTVSDRHTNECASEHACFQLTWCRHCNLPQQSFEETSCNPDQFLLSGRTHYFVNRIFKTTLCHRRDRSICTCLHHLSTGLCDSAEENHESSTAIKLKNF